MRQTGYLHSFSFLIVLAENMVQGGRDGAKAGHSRLAPDHGGKHPLFQHQHTVSCNLL